MIKWFSISLMLLISYAQAQVAITDEGLKQCLLDNHSEILMTNELLDTLESKNLNALHCTGYGIKSLDEAVYFDNLKHVHLDSNEISSASFLSELDSVISLTMENNLLSEIPSLSHMSILEFINFKRNNVTRFPELPDQLSTVVLSFNKIGGTVDLSNMTDLVRIYLNSNEIENLIGYKNLIRLVVLGAFDNKLTILESFENLDSLEELMVFKNQLTSIEGLTNKPKLRDLQINNNLFEDLPEIDLSNLPELRLMGNFLTFEDILALGDTSILNQMNISYEGQKNTFEPEEYTVSEGDAFVWDLELDGDIETNYYLWYNSEELVDSTTVGVYDLEKAALLDAGTYRCVVRNTLLQELSLSINCFNLEVKEVYSEPFALSPDGDGVGDTFLFEQEGQISIYNQAGELVKSNQGSFEWDGRNNTGTILPVGIYMIQIDGAFFSQVSIIK